MTSDHVHLISRILYNPFRHGEKKQLTLIFWLTRRRPARRGTSAFRVTCLAILSARRGQHGCVTNRARCQQPFGSTDEKTHTKHGANRQHDHRRKSRRTSYHPRPPSGICSERGANANCSPQILSCLKISSARLLALYNAVKCTVCDGSKSILDQNYTK